MHRMSQGHGSARATASAVRLGAVVCACLIGLLAPSTAKPPDPTGVEYKFRLSPDVRDAPTGVVTDRDDASTLLTCTDCDPGCDRDGKRDGHCTVQRAVLAPWTSRRVRGTVSRLRGSPIDTLEVSIPALNNLLTAAVRQA